MSIGEIIQIIIGILGLVFGFFPAKESCKPNKNSEDSNNHFNVNLNSQSIVNEGDAVVNNYNITNNYIINQVQNVNSKEKSVQKTVDISPIIIICVLLIVFLCFRILFYSLMAALTILYILKTYFIFKEGCDTKNKVYNISIIIISVLACFFFWMPLFISPNYVDDILSLINSSDKNSGILFQGISSALFAVFQSFGSILFIYVHSTPYISYFYSKLQTKFKWEKNINPPLSKKLQIIFLSISLISISGIVNIL